MPGFRRFAFAFVFVLAASCSPPAAWPPPGAQLVDLTHPFDAETIYWPTEEGFVFERGTAGETAGGYYYEAHSFRGAEHGGTHVDAPIHFFAGGDAVDEVPLERLVGPGVVIDVRDACTADPDYEVRVADFERHEAEHGRIPASAIVLLDTGFGARWPERERYMGTAARGAEGVAGLHFPGLAPAAARWLVDERDVAAIGLDTPSIDHGRSTDFLAHRILFEAGIPAFENVASLAELPADGFTIVALPMKIAGGSGAPLRIVAIVPGS